MTTTATSLAFNSKPRPNGSRVTKVERRERGIIVTAHCGVGHKIHGVTLQAAQSEANLICKRCNKESRACDQCGAQFIPAKVTEVSCSDECKIAKRQAAGKAPSKPATALRAVSFVSDNALNKAYAGLTDLQRAWVDLQVAEHRASCQAMSVAPETRRTKIEAIEMAIGMTADDIKDSVMPKRREAMSLQRNYGNIYFSGEDRI